jgi:hypothetical protein
LSSHPNVQFSFQVEELSRGSKQKSGWSSGWKKVTKTFHSKDHHDYTAKILTEQHKIGTPPPPRRLPSEHTDIPALRTSKSQIVRNLPKTPEAGSTLPLRQESLPNPKPPKADSKPTHEAVVVTPIVPVKNEPIAETQPVKDSSNVASDTIPTSTSAPPEKDMALETSADNNLKDRLKDDVVTRRRQCRSTSPDYVRSRRHHYDSDSTSTSSYTSTSKSVSSHSGHGRRGRGSRRRRRRRDYSEDHRGHRDTSLDKLHSRHHHSSVHKSDHSAGHRQDGPHHSGLHSSEHSHRKHRQKEGSEHHSHHSSQNLKEHHSVDSHPRHTSKDHLHLPNGHRRASHHSSHRRKEVSNKYSSQHRRRHQRHHHKEVFSDSDGNSDSGTRRRHR